MKFARLSVLSASVLIVACGGGVIDDTINTTWAELLTP